MVNVDFQRVAGDLLAPAVKARLQGLPRKHLSGTFHQRLQQHVLTARQLNGLTAYGDSMGRGVE